MAAGRDIFPCVGLVVSGGHTALFRCETALSLELLGGTLSVEERAGVFRMILEDWSDESPGSLRASMVWIASALRPCEGVSEWLREVAGRQADPQYAQYLRECADTIWDKPGT